MNIAVLIKQVPVSNDVSVDPETHALVRASSEGMINPADLNAIEAAMVLKEQTEGKVVVFTMGPPDAEKALRDAMAMGCDESCLITDRCLAGGDTIATAKVLARSIEKFGKFDLILSGALSADGATGQVGAMVAEYMGIPHVSEIQGIAYDENMADSIIATKKAQGMEDQGFIAGAYERMLRLQRAAPGYPSYQEGSQEQADGGVHQRKTSDGRKRDRACRIANGSHRLLRARE